MTTYCNYDFFLHIHFNHTFKKILENNKCLVNGFILVGPLGSYRLVWVAFWYQWKKHGKANVAKTFITQSITPTFSPIHVVMYDLENYSAEKSCSQSGPTYHQCCLEKRTCWVKKDQSFRRILGFFLCGRRWPIVVKGRRMRGWKNEQKGKYDTGLQNTKSCQTSVVTCRCLILTLARPTFTLLCGHNWIGHPRKCTFFALWDIMPPQHLSVHREERTNIHENNNGQKVLK